MYRVIDAVAKVLNPLRAEANRKSAARFVDKVKAVIKAKGKEGCTDSNFTCCFKLEPLLWGVGEADLADFTLDQLVDRGIIRKETRYFLSDE